MNIFAINTLTSKQFYEARELISVCTSVDGTRGYKIGFYDINEVPPKVSVKVDSLTVLAFNAKKPDGTSEKVAANITTSYDAILETTYKEDESVFEGLRSADSDMCTKLAASYS